MTVFVDTSAFYAVLDRDDENHASARRQWEELLKQDATLVTSNYVLLETCALLQSRVGINSVRAFHEEILPVIQVYWISEAAHAAGMAALLSASRRKLSLTDCTSFHLMRDSQIRDAFCFDRHFVEQGFKTKLA